MAEITIGNRKIGDGCPAYIIAEMSANHAGSIERAKEIIRAAKEAGADCVKIQTYTPDTMTINCHNEYFQIDKGLWEGDNLYSLYQKAYTPWEWQKELKEEAEKVGIDFFSTPFDKTSVDFLEGIGVDFYKIASFELVDIPLLEYVASKGKPMIISTGMGSIEEINDAIKAIESQGNCQYAFLKCSSAYPAISEEMNLATIVDMKERFKVPIGLSDHSLGSLGAVAAVAMGACIIEKHFCISREIENPDAAFSMTKDEFQQMVKDIRDVERARGVVQYGITKQEMENRIFRRSLFVVEDMKAGEIINEYNTKVIRPGYGMKPKHYKHIMGKKVIGDIKRGTPLSYKFLEEWGECELNGECDILLLTNNENALCLYEGLKDRDIEVKVYRDKLTLDKLKSIKFNLILSYNYNYIIDKDIVEKYNGRIINMHISFLPWNKGFSPNFWSFYDDTPKGVTIHYIDEKLDTGNIILQKEIELDEKNETFRTSYDKLNAEIVKLFLDNFNDIYQGNIVSMKQNEGGTYHTKKMIDEMIDKYKIDWNEKVVDVMVRINRQ